MYNVVLIINTLSQTFHKSHHPKWKEFVVAYGKLGLCMRVKRQEVIFEEKLGLIYFLEWMYCMQFLGYMYVNPCLVVCFHI